MYADLISNVVFAFEIQCLLCLVLKSSVNTLTTMHGFTVVATYLPLIRYLNVPECKN